MAPQIERVAENYKLGEGPHWDEDTQSLYFVDIPGQKICRYVPATQRRTDAVIGANVSLIIPVKGQENTFVITKARELIVITWDGVSDSISIVKEIATDDDAIFNDGKCDPTGRLWAGTIKIKEGGGGEKEGGSLYTIQKDQMKKVEDKITISNGLAFNVPIKKMYYIDTHKGTVDEFDLDVEKGTIGNRQSIFTLSKHDILGSADGMTIDTDGNLWVAIFNGGRVIKIDPRKPETLLYTISLPAQQPTSVTFGGKNLDELYITTGCIEYETTEKLSPPENGALYKVTGLGVRGVPGEKYVL